MLVAAPEFSCGTVGEDTGTEKPSSVRGPARFASRDPSTWLRAGCRGGRRHIRTGCSGEKGLLTVVGLRNVFGRWGQFQGSGEMGANAGRLFGGGDDPLIEGVADTATLGLVVDHDVAGEVTAGV